MFTGMHLVQAAVLTLEKLFFPKIYARFLVIISLILQKIQVWLVICGKVTEWQHACSNLVSREQTGTNSLMPNEVLQSHLHSASRQTSNSDTAWMLHQFYFINNQKVSQILSGAQVQEGIIQTWRNPQQDKLLSFGREMQISPFVY